MTSVNWRDLKPSDDRTHHIGSDQRMAYTQRFDDVLKFHAPGLAPVSLAGLAWHIKTDGSPAYTNRFLRTFGFYEGLAAVESQEGCFHIDPLGRPVYTERYQWCGNFQEGRCTIRNHDNLYGHITTSGARLYNTWWCYAGDYKDGIAVIQAKDGRSTHIDAQGHFVHSRWFFDLDIYHKGYARARDADGWHHIDEQGEPIYARRFTSVEPFYNGQARVEAFDGALLVIDESGETLVELRPPRQTLFAELSGDMVGFWRTRTIAAAVELNIPETLPTSTQLLAQKHHLPSRRIFRLMRALGELKLVERQGDVWHLTPRGQYLHPSHPMTLADAAIEYAKPFTEAWRPLDEAIKQEGWRPTDVFERVSKDNNRCAGHHRMLKSYAKHDYAALAPLLNLRGDSEVLDAAGGLGVLGKWIHDTYPTIRVSIMERPEVVALGRQQIQAPRLTWHEGDLFDQWPVKADTVILTRVLHDWPDEDAKLILKQARRALNPDGRIIVVEMLMQPMGFSGGLCDLHLLMATGGKERTQKEYDELFQACGFKLIEARSTGGLVHILTGAII